MKILLAGGGTGGPAIPLLAIAQELKSKNPEIKFLFVGTNFGPERIFAKNFGMSFASVPAGKLRRYFSLANLFSPFIILFGFVKALYIISKFRPNIVLGAGGYVSVPVVVAAKILGRKILIHQQDVEPSLTNKILAPLANIVTVTFQESVKDFSTRLGLFKNEKSKRVVWTGNPIRKDLKVDDSEIIKIKYALGLQQDLPVLLILGGATGALGLNKILEQALPELCAFFQIIHSTGKGKGIIFVHKNYHSFEVINEMRDVYASADVVISRAGLSTISELSYLRKVSIIVPMPHSHQERNAAILAENGAAIVLNQDELTAEHLISVLRKLMYNGIWQKELSENISKIMPHDAADKISLLVIELCNKKRNLV